MVGEILYKIGTNDLCQHVILDTTTASFQLIQLLHKVFGEVSETFFQTVSNNVNMTIHETLD